VADHIEVSVENILGSEKGFEAVSLPSMKINEFPHSIGATRFKLSTIRHFVLGEISLKFGIAGRIQIIAKGEYFFNGSEA